MPVASTSPAVIRADELYGMDEFRARTKLGAHAIRVMRRQGFPVRYVSGRAYVLGRDFLEFLTAEKGKDMDAWTDDQRLATAGREYVIARRECAALLQRGTDADRLTAATVEKLAAAKVLNILAEIVPAECVEAGRE